MYLRSFKRFIGLLFCFSNFNYFSIILLLNYQEIIWKMITKLLEWFTFIYSNYKLFRNFELGNKHISLIFWNKMIFWLPENIFPNIGHLKAYCNSFVTLQLFHRTCLRTVPYSKLWRPISQKFYYRN